MLWLCHCVYAYPYELVLSHEHYFVALPYLAQPLKDGHEHPKSANTL